MLPNRHLAKRFLTNNLKKVHLAASLLGLYQAIVLALASVLLLSFFLHPALLLAMKKMRRVAT